MALETVFVKELKAGDKFANMLPNSQIYTVVQSMHGDHTNPNSWFLEIEDQHGDKHASLSHKNQLVTKVTNQWNQ